MKIAVIIPVTRPPYLYRCIKGLNCQTSPHDEFEIILIKGKNMFLELENTDIKTVQIEEDTLHPGFRRNLGVKSTNARILAFIDDDTIPCPDWIRNATRHLEKERIDGVCGPLLQSQGQSSFGSMLAGAANESIFLEGFEDCNLYEKKRVQFFNISLCNVIIKRNVWEAVGGFNGVASYYIDDFEFFYLADKKGFIFYNIPEVTVCHSVEPFPSKYLKKKFITRFYTGMNSIMFNKVYRQIPSIRLAFLAYICIPFMFILIMKDRFYFAILLIVYFGIGLYFSRFVFAKNKLAFFLLPFVFFITHLVNLAAFILGNIFFCIKRNKFIFATKYTNERLKNVRVN